MKEVKIKMDYDATIKICIFGGNNVGKETFISKFIGNERRDDLFTTTGVYLGFKDIDIDGRILRLQLWIFNDEERFQDIWKQYIRDSKGIILMYDITNLKSFDRLTEWVQLIRNKNNDYVSVLLVGNKVDLKENREVSKEQIEKFKMDNGISGSIEISLETGENVENMFLEFFIDILIKNKNHKIKRKFKEKEKFKPISRRQYSPVEKSVYSKKNSSESSKNLELYLNSFNSKYVYLPILIVSITLLNVIGVFMITDIQKIWYISFILVLIIVLTGILLRQRKRKKKRKH